MSKLDIYTECKICAKSLKASAKTIGTCHNCIKDEQEAKVRRERRKRKISYYNF